MTRTARFTVLSAVLTILAGCAATKPQVAAETPGCAAPVALAQGTYRGEDLGDVCAWKGVDFADSGPAYRFRRPGPPQPQKEVVEADAYGRACLAPILGMLGPEGTDENCLNLNLWRPAGTPPPGGWPVMVFMHGGAFLLGAGNWMVYDGASLARNGVAVVTINYRLNVLGFYASEAQRAENPDGAAGNWGMWDQVASLAWLRDNAAAFGANPNSVTIFGESAGGFSVCALLASPAAEGLFHRAIMESGGCLVNNLDESLAFGKQTLARSDCADDPRGEMACLRESDPDDLNFLVSMWKGTAPTVDGVFLREQPLSALRSGRAARVPLLIGSNRDELRPLALSPNIAFALSASADDYWQTVAAAWGDVHALRALYPAARGQNARDLWSRMATDIFFTCTVASAADAHARYAPVYAYEFDIGERRSWADRQMGAYHSVELPYVFGFTSWPRVMGDGYLAEERALAYSRKMQAYWAAFAKAGDPNVVGQEPWPAFSPEGTAVRLQPDRNVALRGHARDRCAYWQANQGGTFAKQAELLRKFSAASGASIEWLFWR